MQSQLTYDSKSQIEKYVISSAGRDPALADHKSNETEFKNIIEHNATIKKILYEDINRIANQLRAIRLTGRIHNENFELPEGLNQNRCNKLKKKKNRAFAWSEECLESGINMMFEFADSMLDDSRADFDYNLYNDAFLASDQIDEDQNTIKHMKKQVKNKIAEAEAKRLLIRAGIIRSAPTVRGSASGLPASAVGPASANASYSASANSAPADSFSSASAGPASSAGSVGSSVSLSHFKPIKRSPKRSRSVDAFSSDDDDDCGNKMARFLTKPLIKAEVDSDVAMKQ